MILSFVLLFLRGLNFGIDFEGGTSWQVQMAAGRTADVAEVRDLIGRSASPTRRSACSPGADGQRAACRRRVLDDPIRRSHDDLAKYGGVQAADVQFPPQRHGRHVHVHGQEGVTPTEAGVTTALAETGSRTRPSVDGQDVTITVEDAAGEPDETGRRRRSRSTRATTPTT